MALLTHFKVAKEWNVEQTIVSGNDPPKDLKHHYLQTFLHNSYTWGKNKNKQPPPRPPPQPSRDAKHCAMSSTETKTNAYATDRPSLVHTQTAPRKKPRFSVLASAIGYHQVVFTVQQSYVLICEKALKPLVDRFGRKKQQLIDAAADTAAEAAMKFSDYNVAYEIAVERRDFDKLKEGFYYGMDNESDARDRADLLDEKAVAVYKVYEEANHKATIKIRALLSLL